jgi:DNA-binding PadR family transcriptional regulator
MADQDPAVRELLPLTPTVFHILLALAEGPRHGYRVMQDVARLSDGQVQLGPGTLYGAIDRMVESGLIETATGPEGAGRGKPRRYYRMTGLGQGALVAESERMAALVGYVRGKKLIPDSGSV